MISTSMLNKRMNAGQIENENHATEMGFLDTSDIPSKNSLTKSGLTLFVRKSTGTTGLLKPHDKFLALLEGPYRNNSNRATFQSDRLLLIGGGMGITGLLPFASCRENAKLFYSVKAEDSCLAESLEPALSEIDEKDIRVGQRLNLGLLLQEETEAGWAKITVVVCGPAGMCDDTRAIVSRIGKELAGKCSLELEVDSFSW
ncbi:unnamed protein product [Periconia digitata]|uniref:Oxidoreductase FAD/NAD(P)-binding domain-containing protein n=1 Tax=Periconia digitata TaxID=1303443 RepID=A0A9W4XDW1_9PLEO|nr:unnamed protein product [Periconia digitata]